MWPSSNHARNLNMMSRPLNEPLTSSDSHIQSAIEVSSVQWPGCRRKGPPPTISLSLSNVPYGWNSTSREAATSISTIDRAPSSRAARTQRRSQGIARSESFEGTFVSVHEIHPDLSASTTAASSTGAASCTAGLDDRSRARPGRRAIERGSADRESESEPPSE